MPDFEPIPRHDPPFTEDDLRRLVASEMNWFIRGSVLYKEALRLRESLDDTEPDNWLYVGLPFLPLHDSRDFARAEREIVSAMLFSMAVECWLKGLLVMTVERKSREIERLLRELSENSVPLTADPTPPEAFRLGPEGRRLQKQIAELRAKEDKEREAAIYKHRKHDLNELAAAVGLGDHLSDPDREYLEFLSAANSLGRYPAPRKPIQVIPWKDLASQPSRWDSLCRVINKRYEQCYSA